MRNQAATQKNATMSSKPPRANSSSQVPLPAAPSIKPAQSANDGQDGSVANSIAQPLCPIFKLPIEIRFIIYEFLFEPEEHDIKLMAERHPNEDWRNGDAWVTPNQKTHLTRMAHLSRRFVYMQRLPDILFTCKLVYTEASPIFYDCRTVYFGNTMAMNEALRAATDTQLATVRRARLMQRNVAVKDDSRIGRPNGDMYAWESNGITCLKKCQNLKHFTMDVGFFWPEMEQSTQLSDIRRLRGLQSITFLGNDGQPTTFPKWSYVLLKGYRQDLRADCEARRLVAFRFYEINPSWVESIRADVTRPRRDYDLRERSDDLLSCVKGFVQGGGAMGASKLRDHPNAV